MGQVKSLPDRFVTISIDGAADHNQATAWRTLALVNDVGDWAVAQLPASSG
jgi:hypothetical protein